MRLSLALASSLALLLSFVVPLPSVSAQILVGDFNNQVNQILEFSNSGVLTRPLVPPNSSPLWGIAGLTVGNGNDLFASSRNNGQVLRYNWKTGAFASVFASGITSPNGLLFDKASNSLYVSDFGQWTGQEIIRYDATTGQEIARFGIGAPGMGRSGMAIGADQKLYVSNFLDSSVTRFDPANNYSAEVFVNPTGAMGFNGIVFDGNGNLNVVHMMSNTVHQFNATGAPLGVISNDLLFPSGIALDTQGNLLVTSMGNDNPETGDIQTGFVGKFNPTTRETIVAKFLESPGPALFNPTAVTQVPNTQFWTGGSTEGSGWSKGGNWDSAVPTANASICFGAVSSGNLVNSNDFENNTTFNGITFTRDAPAYTLEGNRIKLNGPVVNQSTSSNETINLALEMISGGGLFDTGTRNITLGHDLEGTASLLKQGTGTLTIQGDLLHTGSTTVKAGTLTVLGTLSGSPSVMVLGNNTCLNATSIVTDRLTIGSTISGGSAQSVPEPGSAILLGLGLLASLAIFVRRRPW